MSEKYFETDSLGLSYFLVAKGEPLLEVYRNGRFCHFVFDGKAVGLVQEYHNNAPVPVLSLLSAIREVRGRMKSA